MSDTCSVCQDLFKTPKFLSCGHTFCRKCIDEIIESQTKGDIKCPLCRKITKRPKNGATGLMDNFYAADRRHSTSKILRCKECNRITRNKTCKFCCTYFCEKCIFSHTEGKCGGPWKQPSREGSGTQSYEESSLEGNSGEIGGQLMSETVHSNFCFELDNKIVVPNLFQNDYGHVIDINLSRITCTGANNCAVVPNGDKVILIYDECGNEIFREFINIRVVDIASGIAGYPLIIENGTSLIYEYTFGDARQIIWSQPLLPYAISSLNDGKIVLVGTVQMRSLDGKEIQRHGAMHIYEYDGHLVKQTLDEQGEYFFEFPVHVCVNLKNNDIYVGDINKRQVMYFREDGTFVTTYGGAEMVDNFIGGGVLIRSTSNFPMCLTYSQRSDLLLAACHSGVDSKIYVLSPNLELLGLFFSREYTGVPMGMSSDKDGKLFLGDFADGVIRVFKLSKFINRLDCLQ